ncbi:MAG: amidohydrolase family protein [Gemmatimonadota bacterium]|nr:amidohydrolase family protein [Gemmatimonadota bacterium]
MSRRNAALIALSLLTAPVIGAQSPVDSALLAYIASIKAIDTHAHPNKVVAPGMAADTEFDALPLDGLPPSGAPYRLRPENPEWMAGWRALYGYRYTDTLPAHMAELKQTRERIAREQGEHFPDWALDQAGIDVMLANRVVMGTGLGARFRWVSFVDALMLPLDTRGEATRTPDTRALYPLETKLLHRYLRDLGLTTIPATLDAYERTVLTPTLERQRKAGAVAVKFEAAYLRALDFALASASEAKRIYAKYAQGGVPSRAEYKTLEDHLFHVIASEAGRLGMAVHIHATDGGGGFYTARGSDPALLEPTFNDSTLRATNFVIIHGGWPLTRNTSSMLHKPNVYADISMMTFVAPARTLAGVLREWLALEPEKVLFGTDAFGTPEQGWEEIALLSSNTARAALAMALTDMMRDGEITRDRAQQLARMVMRENAIAANHLGPMSGVRP